MDATDLGCLMDFANTIPDPRRHNAVHPLPSIVAIMLLATIGGSDTFTQIADWARTHEGFLSDALDLPRGIPSHDTIGRVMRVLEPDGAEAFFQRYARHLAEHGATQPTVESIRVGEGPIKRLAVDGKTCRGSLDAAAGRSATHMVSAFCSDSGLSLGQLATDAKSNEITAIPELLKMLDLKNYAVTIDAAGCQKQIVSTITERGGDFLLQVKANQPGMLDAIRGAFVDHRPLAEAGEPVEKAHGRVETRTAATLDAGDVDFDWSGWPKVAAVVRVTAARVVGEKASGSARYYITNLPAGDAEDLLSRTRGHWAVENQLHWSLDVSFGDDRSRARKDHAAENLSRFKRLALGLLKRAEGPYGKMSIDRKRKVATGDPGYAARVALGQA